MFENSCGNNTNNIKHFILQTNPISDGHFGIFVLPFQTIDRSMNTYDLIGSLHSGQASALMHNGPNFLGRHNLFVLV